MYDTEPLYRALAILFNKFADHAVAVAVAATLGVSLVLLLFAFPVADDYGRAALVLTNPRTDDVFAHSWLEYVLVQYRWWTGRWAAMALYAAVLPNVNITSSFYPAALLLLYAACLLAFYAALRILFANSVGRTRVVMLAAGFLALYWAGMPRPGETFYWFTGGSEYTLPFALTVFAFCVFVRVANWFGTLVSAALAFLATGLHEFAGLTLMAVFSVAAASAFAMKSATRHRWAFVFLFALVGTAINGFAPGNHERIEFEGFRSPDMITVIKVTALQFTQFLIPWLIDVKLLAASVALLATPWFRQAQPAWTLVWPEYWRFVIPGVTLLTITALFFVMAWNVGGIELPLRLYNFIYGLFLLGWIATLLVWAPLLGRSGNSVLFGRARKVASVVFALALVFSVSVVQGIGDLLGEQNVARFRIEMQQRFATIAESRAAGVTQVVLDHAPRIPESYYPVEWDIGADPQHWRNRYVAAYFRLDEIRIDADAIDCHCRP